jgi:general secretion pathway protein G
MDARAALVPGSAAQDRAQSQEDAPMIKQHSRPSIRRGFTLLEMLIVIGIILALGGVVLYNLIGIQEKSEKDIMQVQLQSFDSALQQFRVAMGRYPSEEEGLKVLWSKDTLQEETDAGKWQQFMTQPVPQDKWGNEWIYHQPSQLVEGAAYDIISVGPDKQEGTADDISNHTGKTEGEGSSDDFSDFAPAEGTGG